MCTVRSKILKPPTRACERTWLFTMNWWKRNCWENLKIPYNMMRWDFYRYKKLSKVSILCSHFEFACLLNADCLILPINLSRQLQICCSTVFQLVTQQIDLVARGAFTLQSKNISDIVAHIFQYLTQITWTATMNILKKTLGPILTI